MLSEYVVPGNKIEIRPVNQDEFGEEILVRKKVYQSQVSDILSEDRLEILMPFRSIRNIPFSFLPRQGSTRARLL